MDRIARSRGVSGKTPKGGFTLIELLVVIAIIALLIGILLPALAEARRLARLSICQSDQAQHGKGQGSYAADFEDRTYSFTWRTGHRESTFADLQAQANGGPDTGAAAAQAVDILRRRAGRTDIAPIGGWIPHVLYTHLVLQDYWASRLPEKIVVCPEDNNRLDWQQDNGKLHDANFWAPFQEPASAINKRWPYSSSYHVVPATYDVNQSRDINAQGGTTVQSRLYQGGNAHNLYTIPNANLGGTRLADVAFPGSKVQLYDEQARHFGETRAYFYTDAKAPILFFDGSVRVFATGETNAGWNPNAPGLNQDTFVNYTPRVWESPVRGGPNQQPPPNGSETLPTWYRWTRGGLKGTDVGGSAVPAGL